jgi:hypothetical protein
LRVDGPAYSTKVSTAPEPLPVEWDAKPDLRSQLVRLGNIFSNSIAKSSGIFARESRAFHPRTGAGILALCETFDFLELSRRGWSILVT